MSSGPFIFQLSLCNHSNNCSFTQMRKIYRYMSEISDFSVVRPIPGYSHSRLIRELYVSTLNDVFPSFTEFVDNSNMKEIKGLSERLASLEHRVSIVQQLVQDQTDMAQVSTVANSY